MKTTFLLSFLVLSLYFVTVSNIRYTVQYVQYCVHTYIADKEPEDPEQHVRGEPGHLRPRHDDHPGKPGGGLILKLSVSALNTHRQEIFELGFLSPGFLVHIPKLFQLQLWICLYFFSVSYLKAWLVWGLGSIVLYIQHVHLLGLILPPHNVSALVLEAYC